MEQHCKAGGTLDQRAHRGSVKADDQVTFPVTWNSTISSLSRSFTGQIQPVVATRDY
jgi:hypothetical protein